MFIKNSKHEEDETGPGAKAPRSRGRPRGATPQGVATRERLYQTATRLIAARGFDATTLRDIAKEAGVSPGLLYRYFPSKRAVVLALYDELSAEYATRASHMQSGPWRERFAFALKTSLDVLGPQRKTLAALLPVLIGDTDEGLFAPATAFSRRRVQSVFHNAVSGATDTLPSQEDAAALGRVLYAVHLAVILWWLIDKSPNQRSTTELVTALEGGLPMASFTLRLKTAKGWLRTADALCQVGLFGDTEGSGGMPCP